MSDQTLPTWAEMATTALAHLDTARIAASSVRDELTSDWRPVGTALTPEAAEARREVLRVARQIKDLVDEAKGYLEAAR